MPLALTYTKGVLDQSAATSLGKAITDAFLHAHGLAGNRVMTPNVTMQITALDEAGSLAGGEVFSGVWLECKVPAFALADREIQTDFFARATDLIEAATNFRIPRERIFTNAVHTVDGTWNLDGRAQTNEQLGEAISAG